MNLVLCNEGKCLRQREAKDLDVFIGFWLSNALANIARQVDLHPLTEEARAGEVFGKESPAFGPVACLFDQLALGGSEGCLFGLDPASGQLKEKLTRGVPVLAFKDNFGVGGVLRIVDGQNHNGAVMANDVTS